MATQGNTTQSLRVATYNVSMNRSNEGELIDDLSNGDDTQAQNVAQIIQTERPDVVLLNEFDFDADGTAAELFQSNYLSVSQGGETPIDYPFVYVAPSNTGIATGLDLDNNGATDGPGDAQGFGFFEGQFGFIILSQYPIVDDGIRTFQEFLWKDMPDSQLTDTSDGSQPLYDPNAPEVGFYSQEEVDILRLSSKNHVDVPIDVDGEIVHILAAHPTPPVFDGAEDRNGKRNHDEIRFWSDYVEGADYIYDDQGTKGGLDTGERFVIVGDYNADPFDGDSRDEAAQQFLDNDMIIGSATDPSITPAGNGSFDQPGGANSGHTGNAGFDTADFGFNGADPSSDNEPGNLRVDYALPSAFGFTYVDGAVVWPDLSDPYSGITNFPTSDHRMVWVDLELTETDLVTADLTPVLVEQPNGVKRFLDVQSGEDIGIFGAKNFSVVALDDLDGDGKGDVLMRNTVSGRYQAVFADGSTVNIGQKTSDFITTLDVDGDGDAEVLMRREGGNFFLTDASSGEFVSNLGRSLNDMFAAGDVNGDGIDDIIATNSAGRLVWIDLADGNATHKFGVSTAAQAIAVADINGDGADEVIIERSDGKKVALDSDGNVVAAYGRADAKLVAAGDFVDYGAAELVFEKDGFLSLVDGATGATLEESSTNDSHLLGVQRGDTGHLDQLVLDEPASDDREAGVYLHNVEADAFTKLALNGNAVVTTSPTGLGYEEASAFQFGVASGDPDANSIVLWTHARPEFAAVGEDVTVSWEIATDAEFSNVVGNGTGTTNADQDYTFKVIADGLVAGGEYYYRFMVGDDYSETGQTRTLPEGKLSAVEFAIFSCVNFPAGFFNAYEAAVEDGFDYSIHLGDYIYEYGIGGYATEAAEALGRLPMPAEEIVSLDDYLGRYAQYTSDADLQALRAAAPMIMMWDDHETANDSWETGAENHNADDPNAPEFGVTWEERTDAALEAYYLWNPLREPETDLRDADKSYEFGDLVDLHMLETRLQARDETRADIFSAVTEKVTAYSDPEGTELFLDAALAGIDEEVVIDTLTNGTQEEQQALFTGIALTALVAEAKDTNREMIGEEQLNDLVAKIDSSDATWQIIGSQTLMGSMELPAEVLLGFNDLAALFINSALGLTAPDEEAFLDGLDGQNEVPYNFDSWDGYQAEREAILEALGASDSGGIVIAGDTHNAWMSNLRTEDGDLVAVEFATPGVTSPGLENLLPEIINPFTGERLDVFADTFVRYVDDLVYANVLDRGYIDLEITQTEAQANYVYVSTTQSKEFDTEVVTQITNIDQFDLLV